MSAGEQSVSDDETRERLRRLEASVARSLELLRAGSPEQAERELAQVAGVAGRELGGVSELELDAAFATARPETERMRDADQVAREAMLASGAHELDGPPEPQLDAAPEPAIAPPIDEPLPREQASALPPSFATETMAGLLESQGDAHGASRIRAGLAAADPAPDEAGRVRPSRQQVIETLELWLDNVRRVRA